MIVDTLTAKMAFDGSDFFAGVTAVKGGLTSMGKAAHSASSLLDEAQDELRQFAEQTKAINAFPLEKYQQQVQKLNNALAMGLIDQTTFSRAMTRAGNTLHGVAPQANAVGSAIQSFGSQMLAAVGFGTAFAGVLTVINTTLSALKTVANATFQALSFGAKLAAEAEDAQIGFKVMLDSGRKAAKLMKDLERFAINTPFDMSGLQQSVTTLLGAGVGESDLLPALQTLGSLSSGDVEKLKELAIVYGQVQSKGKLLAQDFNQITEKGINMRQALADEVGVSVKDLAKTMEAGKISFEDFRNALIEVSETKFGGILEEKSQGAIGTFNRLKEVSGGLLKDIAADLGAAFNTTDLLNDLAGFVEYVRSEWKDEISGAFIFVGHVIVNVFDQIMEQLNLWATASGTALEAVGRIWTLTGNVGASTLGDIGQQLRIFGTEGMGKSASGEFAAMLRDFNKLNPKGKPQEGLAKVSTPFDVFGRANDFLFGGKGKDGKKDDGALKDAGMQIGDLLGGITAGVSRGFDFAAKGFPDLVDGKFAKPKAEEIKKTGSLEVGSREAFSEIIRNMFGKSKEEKSLVALRGIKDAVNAVERTIDRAMLRGATVIDSFAG